jgi:hypothetical protein
MKKSIRILLLLLFAAPFATARPIGKSEPRLLPEKVLQANSVYIDCVCPRALAVARTRAQQQLQAWGRFQIVEGLRQADLVILFSGNEYLGDLWTRDGPDKRPVQIESTIMTVIDAHTGAALWSDSRRWGSWRVDGATKSLIEEFRDLMTAQLRRWTLNDLMMCAVTPIYQVFDHLSPEEALKSDPGAARIADKPNRLSFESSLAPAFCKQVELIVGADNKITGYEVSASPADDLNVNEVLLHADLFDFTGGKFSNGDRVYFSAAKKDKKMLIHFNVEGHTSVFSSVTYYY